MKINVHTTRTVPNMYFPALALIIAVFGQLRLRETESPTEQCLFGTVLVIKYSYTEVLHYWDSWCSLPVILPLRGQL